MRFLKECAKINAKHQNVKMVVVEELKHIDLALVEFIDAFDKLKIEYSSLESNINADDLAAHIKKIDDLKLQKKMKMMQLQLIDKVLYVNHDTITDDYSKIIDKANKQINSITAAKDALELEIQKLMNISIDAEMTLDSLYKNAKHMDLDYGDRRDLLDSLFYKLAEIQHYLKSIDEKYSTTNFHFYNRMNELSDNVKK